MGCFVSRVGGVNAHFLCFVKQAVFIYVIVCAFHTPVAQGKDFRAEQVIDELQRAFHILAAGGDAKAVGHI